MDLKELIPLTKDQISSGKTEDHVIDYLASHKVYHIKTVIVILASLEVTKEKAEELVYKNEYYSSYKDEVNPFNEWFLDGLDEEFDDL
ncbi:MAG: hypothetical protein JKY09_08395 [Crocinitomicaceae bacterium]|nr:hypothetical protein [Crocinitomicaceae bacterium]